MASLLGLPSEFLDQLDIVGTLFHCQGFKDALLLESRTRSLHLKVLAKGSMCHHWLLSLDVIQCSDECVRFCG